MATSAGESDHSSEHSIEINGTNEMICAKCFKKGEENGAVGICKECKYYLCSQCVEDHRKDEQCRRHGIAFFYCETNRRVNRLVRANTFCLDCGHYLCEKCKLDHGGFRMYRHHSFIGGKKLPDIPLERELTRKTLSSRHSSKTVSKMSKITLKGSGRKSPYLSSMEIDSSPGQKSSPVMPRKRTVKVDEPTYQRPRTLIKTTTGTKQTKDAHNTVLEKEKKPTPKTKSVHYEDDHVTGAAELIGEYDLKSQGDKANCHIIASVFLDNEKLVVADGGNKNIKLYDTQYRNESSMEIAKFPVALCPSKHTSSELFASSGNKLFLIDTSTQLTLVRTTETDIPKIEGLAPWESGVALIFKSLKSRNDKRGHLEVHLLSHEGTVQYEITISGQFSVKMVTPIWYITTSSDGRELLLSDTNLNRIICIDIENWHVVYVVRGKTKGGAPRSLAVDPDGNLLVTWYGEVHKISQHGKDLGVPVKNVDKQSIIAYNQRTNNLVVHSWSKLQPNRFRVYHIE